MVKTIAAAEASEAWPPAAAPASVSIGYETLIPYQNPFILVPEHRSKTSTTTTSRLFWPTRKFFRRRENFRKKRSGRRDRFSAKIVEIGAILAIFEPFEVRNFARHFLANSAHRPRIWANHTQIRANPGTIGRIHQKMACEIFELQTAQKSRGWLRFRRFFDQNDRVDPI